VSPASIVIIVVWFARYRHAEQSAKTPRREITIREANLDVLTVASRIPRTPSLREVEYDRIFMLFLTIDCDSGRRLALAISSAALSDRFHINGVVFARPFLPASALPRSVPALRRFALAIISW